MFAISPWLRLARARAHVAQLIGATQDEAEELVREILATGKVHLRERRPDGRVEIVPPERLLSARFDFERSTLAPELTMTIHSPDEDEPSALTFGSGVVELNTVQLLEHVRVLRGSDQASGTKPPARAGRPPQLPWAELAIEVGRWVFQRGFPEPRALLVDHLLDCLAGRNLYPARRTVERWLADTLAEIELPYPDEPTK